MSFYSVFVPLLRCDSCHLSVVFLSAPAPLVILLCHSNEALSLSRLQWDFAGDSDGKESTCNARDLSLTPGLGRSPGEGIGYPIQYSCLENSMNRGAWWATVDGVAKSQT